MKVPSFISEMSRPVKIAMIIALALVMTLIIYKVYRAFKKPANAKYVAGGGALPDGWTPDTIAEKLFNAISGIFTLSGTKDDAYKAFNDLNDNQMIAVYNYWLKNYADKKSYFLFPMGSLTEAVKSETGYVAVTGENQQDIMIANLNRLKLP